MDFGREKSKPPPDSTGASARFGQGGRGVSFSYGGWWEKGSGKPPLHLQRSTRWLAPIFCRMRRRACKPRQSRPDPGWPKTQGYIVGRETGGGGEEGRGSQGSSLERSLSPLQMGRRGLWSLNQIAGIWGQRPPSCLAPERSEVGIASSSEAADIRRLQPQLRFACTRARLGRHREPSGRRAGQEEPRGKLFRTPASLGRGWSAALPLPGLGRRAADVSAASHAGCAARPGPGKGRPVPPSPPGTKSALPPPSPPRSPLHMLGATHARRGRR